MRARCTPPALEQRLRAATVRQDGHPGIGGALHRRGTELHNLRTYLTWAGLPAFALLADASLRLAAHQRNLAGLLLAAAVAVAGTLFGCLRTESAWRRGSTRSAARSLTRGWRQLPADWLAADVLADAGLHRRVAAALGDPAHVDTAAWLLDGGFTGSAGDLVRAATAVLTPAG